MSLLALCGFHERKKMVDLLLKEGAGNKFYVQSLYGIATLTNEIWLKQASQVVASTIQNVDYNDLMRSTIQDGRVECVL